MPDFISIIDCAACSALVPMEENASEIPGKWQHLSRIAALSRAGADWKDRWEVWMCPACGSYFEYRLVHDDGDVLRAESTTCHLDRLTPHRALSRLDQAPAEREIHARRYPDAIKALRSDLGRAQKEASLGVKYYLIEALTEHDLCAADWESLRTALLDHPDPAIRVETARRLLWRAWRGEEFHLTHDTATAVRAVLTEERKQLLVAILAEGLSHEAERIGHFFYDGYGPARVDWIAIETLEDCPRRGTSIAPAVPALAERLLEPDEARRHRARDLLIRHVGRTRDRAGAVLEAIGRADTEETRAVSDHCREVLDSVQ